MENEKKIDLLIGFKEELIQSKLLQSELITTVNLLQMQIKSNANEISNLNTQKLHYEDLIEKSKIQISQLENEIINNNKTNLEFKILNSSLVNEAALLKKELAQSYQSIDSLKNSIKDMEQSICWKMTKPIRMLVPIKLTNWLHQLLKHYKS